MLGFVQKHRTQSKPPKLFLIDITHFWIIGVLSGRLASASFFLDQVLGGGHIYLDMSIKGGFAQECQPFLIEIRAMEQFAIRGTSIDQECSSGVLPIQR